MGSWQEPLAPYQHVTYWHTICYSCVTKTDKCQEDWKLFTYPKKITGSKTKYRKTAWTAVWARHWSARNRSRKTRGLKKTTHRMCRDGIIWPFRIHLSCYLKLQNKIAERTCRTAPHWYLLTGWYLVRYAFLVWIIIKKICDNPHWESNSIGDQCVTK